MKKINQKIVTRTGEYEAIRVDPSFICACGCGRRINSKYRFFSKECYGKYVRENKIVRNSPDSYKKGKKTSKEMKLLLEGMVL